MSPRKDIPKRLTLRAKILRRAEVATQAVREKLHTLPGKYFTFDAWTEAGDPYLSMTGHYIDALIDRPNDWELKTDQLGFEEIEAGTLGRTLPRPSPGWSGLTTFMER